jgi:hypothetical protein
VAQGDPSCYGSELVGDILDIHCLRWRVRGHWVTAFSQATSGKVFIGAPNPLFADFESALCLIKCYIQSSCYAQSLSPPTRLMQGSQSKCILSIKRFLRVLVTRFYNCFASSASRTFSLSAGKSWILIPTAS